MAPAGRLFIPPPGGQSHFAFQTDAKLGGGQHGHLTAPSAGGESAVRLSEMTRNDAFEGSWGRGVPLSDNTTPPMWKLSDLGLPTMTGDGEGTQKECATMYNPWGGPFMAPVTSLLGEESTLATAASVESDAGSSAASRG